MRTARLFPHFETVDSFGMVSTLSIHRKPMPLAGEAVRHRRPPMSLPKGTIKTKEFMFGKVTDGIH
jgi:hypothetical protein